MKDLETIFREHRIACDDMILCPLDDWNAIASQVSDLEAINAEMYAMLEALLADGDVKKPSWKAKAMSMLLAKARGES